MLEAEIQVFSGGLSENECKYLNKRDHKFYCTFFCFRWCCKIFVWSFLNCILNLIEIWLDMSK